MKMTSNVRLRLVFGVLVLVLCSVGVMCGPDLDHYAILEVTSSATQVEIKAAFRRLALQFHPDKNSEPNAVEKFRQVSDAYAVLGDPEKRTAYDSFGGGTYYNRWEYEQAQKAGNQKHQDKDFYINSDLVTTLTQANFYSLKRPSFVEFYAPWCIHCQRMTGEWKKVAIMLEGTVRVGAVNCERNQPLCQQLGIHSFPTIMLYLDQESGGEKYEGEHKVEAFYAFVQQSRSSNLVELNADQFNRQVRANTHVWLVDFSAGPWCGPCTHLKPALRRLSTQVDSTKIKVGIVNCDQQAPLCQQLRVPHYPHIRLFTAKDKEGVELNMQNLTPAQNVLQLFGTIASALVANSPQATAHKRSQHDDDQHDDDDHRYDDL